MYLGYFLEDYKNRDAKIKAWEEVAEILLDDFVNLDEEKQQEARVVPILTTCLFLALLCFLLCCLCWGNKNGLTDFYEPGECSSKKESRDFLKNSVNNLMLFRRFSTANEPEPVFTSNNLPFSKMINVSDPESDLLDSMEEKKSFDNLTLQFDECYERLGAPKEDLRSCISTDSLNTFYSAHPSLVRTNSRNSFISVISDGDLETLIS